MEWKNADTVPETGQYEGRCRECRKKKSTQLWRSHAFPRCGECRGRMTWKKPGK